MKNVLAIVGLMTMAMPLQVMAFSTDNHRWAGTSPQVAVTIQSSIPGAWIAPIARSMNAWNNVGARFRFVAGSDDHNVALKNLWWMPGSTVAATYIRELWGTRINDRDTDFNSRHPFDIDGRANSYDVQDVMAHELGHWLQLNDLDGSANYSKTMYLYSFFGSTYRRSLEQDDINGIRSLYGQ